VDDDEDLAKVLSLFLEHLGHESVTSDQVDEAMQIVENDLHGFSFAFVDHQMSMHSSADFAEWLLRSSDGIGVIIMSGFPLEPDELPVGFGHRLTFLQKPFRPADVAMALQQVSPVSWKANPF
jgi:DNA-binding NtrC family response regulator